MIKRSRANRTEKVTYRNNRNEHKFIDVVHHGDGHYYIIQYIKHELPERTVVNYMGTRCGHKQKFPLLSLRSVRWYLRILIILSKTVVMRSSM